MPEFIFWHCRILWCRDTLNLCGDKHRNSSEKNKCFDADKCYILTVYSLVVS